MREERTFAKQSNTKIGTFLMTIIHRNSNGGRLRRESINCAVFLSAKRPFDIRYPCKIFGNSLN